MILPRTFQSSQISRITQAQRGKVSYIAATLLMIVATPTSCGLDLPIIWGGVCRGRGNHGLNVPPRRPAPRRCPITCTSGAAHTAKQPPRKPKLRALQHRPDVTKQRILSIDKCEYNARLSRTAANADDSSEQLVAEVR